MKESEIKNLVKNKMKEQRYSIKALSEEGNIGYASFYGWLKNEKKTIQLKTLLKVLRVLSIEIDLKKTNEIK